MRNLPKIELMRRAVRQKVCTHCWQRPPGSESDPPDTARSCEAICTIFENLPQLAAIAHKTRNDPLPPLEMFVRHSICQGCEACESAGDFCHDRLTRDCPLSRYTEETIAALEPLVG